MDTVGSRLQKDLGLEFFLYVRYRLYILSYFTIMVVYYDSHRPEWPITIKRLNDDNVIKLFRFGSNRRPIVSPLGNLYSFNGNLTNKVVLSVDLCGSYLKDRELILSREDGKGLNFLQKVEHHEKEASLDEGTGSYEYIGDLKENPSPSFFILHSKGIGRLIRLCEFLTFPSLIKNAGMSGFTKNFKKERNKIMGRENHIARLVKCAVFKRKDVVEFYWHTPATDKYGKNHKFKSAIPSDFGLINNPKESYTIGLRVLDFFKWMDTYEKGYPIGKKDLKDILKVANIQVYSTDPSFHWQGMNWNISQLDASMYPTDIAPKVWNKEKYHGDGNAFISKHMTGIFNSMEFYLNQMVEMLNKVMKEKGYF